MKYDGIIFDLDGTLWDAVEEGRLVLLEYLKTQPDVTHLPTKEEYAGVMGLGMDDLAEKLFPYLSYERRMQIFNEISSWNVNILRSTAQSCTHTCMRH